jgi:hypothetical protein
VLHFNYNVFGTIYFCKLVQRPYYMLFLKDLYVYIWTKEAYLGMIEPVRYNRLYLDTAISSQTARLHATSHVGFYFKDSRVMVHHSNLISGRVTVTIPRRVGRDRRTTTSYTGDRSLHISYI